MASKHSNVNEIVKQTSALSLQSTDEEISEAANYYAARDSENDISFARSEKGLLLFIYAYENSKDDLAKEMLFWDHRICANIITNGQCSKAPGECNSEHESTYRQSNLCTHWYIKSRCTFGTKCHKSHRLEKVPTEHRYILTENDSQIYQLIRFIRNFAGHFLDYVIEHRNELMKDVIIVMVHLVHVLSRRRDRSVDHLNLFLEKTTINQMIAAEELLRELGKPYNVPDIFFDIRINYNAVWYRPTANKRKIDFSQLSRGFVTYFNRIFVEYYQGRLKSRGAKPAWS